MVIKFSDDATTATMGAILEVLSGWTLEIEYIIGPDGFPERGAIHSADNSGIVISDVDAEGAPMPAPLYHAGYDDIISITVI
jgi:hypothetical protein